MEENIGYRYSQDDKDIYIIKISYSKDREKYDAFTRRNSLPPVWFHCDNCLCLTITNANTGEEKEQISLFGMHRNYVEYRKNSVIPGETWYVHNFDDLFRKEYAMNLLKKAKDGTIYVGKTGYEKLEEMLNELCHCSLDEAAKEMCITRDELVSRLEWLKEGHVNEDDIAKPIIEAGNAVYRRKVENGEIIPRKVRIGELISGLERGS